MKRTAFVLAALLSAGTALANDVDPFGFDNEIRTPSTKTREEVKADVIVARSKGELLRLGELGQEFVDPPSTKSRAQVAAETREAGRLGLLSRYGEQEPKVATPEQERQIKLAGERALHQGVAAK